MSHFRDQTSQELVNTHHLSLSYIRSYSIACLDSEIGVSPFFQNGYKAFSYKLAFAFIEYEEGDMK